MAFNPDSYLKKTDPFQGQKSGFDPDAYLAKTQEPAGSAPQAALESFGNTVLLGNLPQLQAAAGRLLPDPSGGVDAKLKAQGFTIDQPDSYVEDRDQNIRRQEQLKRDFPKASLAGTVAGIGATVPMGAGRMAATAAGRVKQGAALGAATGFLANPGDVEGVVNPIQLGGRLENTIVGAGTGAAVAKSAEELGPIFRWISQKMGRRSAEKAVKALGGTKKENELLIDSGQDLALGRQLLKEDAIPFFGSPKRILSRVEAAKAKSGERIGQIVDQANDVRAGYTPIRFETPTTEVTPIRFSTPKAPTQVQPEVLATPIRIDENPMRRAMPWLREADAPPVIVRGETQPIQKAMFTPPQTKVVAGKVKKVPVAGARPQVIAGAERSQPAANAIIDGKSLADRLRGDPDIRRLKEIPGAESLVGRVDSMLETLEGSGEMTIKKAQSIRQGIDDLINWSKSRDELPGVQKVLVKMRDSLRGAMNDVAERVGAGDLRAENTRFSRLARAEDMVSGKVARDAANRSIGLTDTLSGGTGATVGAMVGGPTGAATGAAVGALINKVGRKYGAAMSSRTYDAASKLLRKSPAVTAFLNQNPLMAQVLLNKISRPEGFQPGKSDPILKNEQIMSMFRANPELIEAVQDEKLKAAIRKAIGRGPAGR